MGAAIATNGYALVNVPVTLPDNYQSGLLPVEALKASRKGKTPGMIDAATEPGWYSIGDQKWARPDLKNVPDRELLGKIIPCRLTGEELAATTVHSVALDPVLLGNVAKALGHDSSSVTFLEPTGDPFTKPWIVMVGTMGTVLAAGEPLPPLAPWGMIMPMQSTAARKLTREETAAGLHRRGGHAPSQDCPHCTANDPFLGLVEGVTRK
jgi:hypothetical protein